MIENKKKLRKYEVEIQVVKAEVYSVYAENDSDLLEKASCGLVEKEGKLIKTKYAENMLGNWKQI